MKINITTLIKIYVNIVSNIIAIFIFHSWFLRHRACWIFGWHCSYRWHWNGSFSFAQILQNHGVDLLVFQVLFWLKISQPFFLFYEQQTKKIEISFLMIFWYFFVPFVHPIAYLWIQAVKYSRGCSFSIKNFGVFRSRSRSQQVKTLGIGVGIGIRK